MYIQNVGVYNPTSVSASVEARREIQIGPSVSYTLEKAKPDSTENVLLLKNPQFKPLYLDKLKRSGVRNKISDEIDDKFYRFLQVSKKKCLLSNIASIARSFLKDFLKALTDF